MANFALNYSFSRNLPQALDEDAVMGTLAEVKDYVTTKGKCYSGQLFSVVRDGDNNGLYIAIFPTDSDDKSKREIVKVGDGSGNGSVAVPTYDLALNEATSDNKGQIIYVETKTYYYKKSTGEYVYSTEEPGEGVTDKTIFDVGPYIVVGDKTLSKIGTTSASGEDVSSTIDHLKAEISEMKKSIYWVEGELFTTNDNE